MSVVAPAACTMRRSSSTSLVTRSRCRPTTGTSRSRGATRVRRRYAAPPPPHPRTAPRAARPRPHPLAATQPATESRTPQGYPDAPNRRRLTRVVPRTTASPLPPTQVQVRKWIRNAAALELAAPQAASQTKAKTSGPEYPPLSYPVSPTTDSPPPGRCRRRGTCKSSRPAQASPCRAPWRLRRRLSPPTVCRSRGAPRPPLRPPTPLGSGQRGRASDVRADGAAAAPGLTWVPHGGGLIGAPSRRRTPTSSARPGRTPTSSRPRPWRPRP